jgi:hypothetical protein
MAPVGGGPVNGDDLMDDLLSSLGPLLALFGGQVIRQFLSMSIGWADDVLLAIGSLGIVTVAVSAIRIRGSKTEKALIWRLVEDAPSLGLALVPARHRCPLTLGSAPYRAREERSSVEKELLSSTSADVCEMWTGKQIVRTKGQHPAGMNTMIITKDGSVMDVATAWTKEILGFHRQGSRTHAEVLGEIRKNAGMPPNLALNIQDSMSLTRESWTLAHIGFAAQLLVLTGTGLHQCITDPDRTPSYILYALGTILLSLGI